MESGDDSKELSPSSDSDPQKVWYYLLVKSACLIATTEMKYILIIIE